ncbi:ATP-dependent 6-phosphofructokinase [Calidifontibacter sp. DB0510]|uniref:ATP-dependent 6-phosphofructokinase n=1 Tax=Metallococcus carri TaxID=1656884 RepID=A0A967B351_9MICO|nr:ATP-dependent 6-phosphofructokinase [Metallococcus carri]NHN57157.1 ATP-dependent 6-phosphofructokinase [Metallococcus carri]NOP38040.1 ATP-dependent 6-phosphofructokinase [Calidifontibacter sp. DB2511S]
MNIGILTAGGDCPGLNAVIRGAVMKGDRIHGQTFLGIRDGWRGLVEDDVIPLPRHEVRGLSRQGGTILGTSRVSPFRGDAGGAERVKEVMAAHAMDAIIAIGGEGTLTVARMLYDEGVPIVGVPKTIDNDLSATDYTFGFDTAVSIATESVDRLRTTAESHHRCMVVEVMGRHVGWIALHAGLAGGAHAVLVPEVPVTLDQVCEWVESARDRGRAPLVVVAEGFTLEDGDIIARDAVDGFGRPRLGGVGEALGPLIEERTGIETRVATLGHLQRGGVPTSYDRVLATRFGAAAIDAVVERKWGTMVSLRGIDIETVDLRSATTELKVVPRHRWDEAAVLFG